MTMSLSTVPAPPMRLYWFPHAGGRARSYAAWRAQFPAHVEHTPIEYPGHGARTDLPARTMDALENALLREHAFDDDVPFAFVGHSMGALVAFAVTAALHQRGRRLPRWLCVSGRNGPELHTARSAPRTDAELVATLRALGGTPEDVLSDVAQRTRMLQSARADFEILDGFRPAPVRVPVPITAYYGRDDVATRPEAVLTWSWWTSQSFALRRFEGSHFFPFGRRREFAATLLADLMPHVSAPSSHPRLALGEAR